MELIEVRTGELVGAALDWAVGIAEGWEPDRPQDGQLRKTWLGCTQYVLVGKDSPCVGGHRYSPSTDWGQGGALIEKYCVSLERNAAGFCDAEQPWYAEIHDDWATGAGPLVAACRALVGFKFGDVVSVPAALVEQSA